MIAVDQDHSGLRELGRISAGELADPARCWLTFGNLVTGEGDPEATAQRIVAVQGDTEAQAMPRLDLTKPLFRQMRANRHKLDARSLKSRPQLTIIIRKREIAGRAAREPE